MPSPIYVQHNVRYVAINIGIGGYQSHMAGDIFANSYGDCKDKATLLVTMLHEAGIDAYFTLVSSERGVVDPARSHTMGFQSCNRRDQTPSRCESPSLYTTVNDPKLGKFFSSIPLTTRPVSERCRRANKTAMRLVITGQGGELIKMPVAFPALESTFASSPSATHSRGRPVRGSGRDPERQ